MIDSDDKIEKLRNHGLIKKNLSAAEEAALRDALKTMDDDVIDSLASLAEKFRKKVGDHDPNLLNCFVPL